MYACPSIFTKAPVQSGMAQQESRCKSLKVCGMTWRELHKCYLIYLQHLSEEEWANQVKMCHATHDTQISLCGQLKDYYILLVESYSGILNALNFTGCRSHKKRETFWNDSLSSHILTSQKLGIFTGVCRLVFNPLQQKKNSFVSFSSVLLYYTTSISAQLMAQKHKTRQSSIVLPPGTFAVAKTTLYKILIVQSSLLAICSHLSIFCFYHKANTDGNDKIHFINTATCSF